MNGTNILTEYSCHSFICVIRDGALNVEKVSAAELRLIMDDNQRAAAIGLDLGRAGRQGRIGPVKQPFGVLGAQIDAAVAHGLAKVVMPISPV